MRATPVLAVLLAAALRASPGAVPAAAAAAAASRLPAPELNLQLEAPIKTWDEAIPLGNGLLGGLLWGEGRLLRLSLDRGDLWDERPAEGVEWSRLTYTMGRDLVEAGKNDEFNRLFDKPYDGLHPTKIPAGRIEIALPAGQDVSAFELSLADAQAHVRAGDAASIDAFFSAAERVALMRIPGSRGADARDRGAPPASPSSVTPHPARATGRRALVRAGSGSRPSLLCATPRCAARPTRP